MKDRTKAAVIFTAMLARQRFIKIVILEVIMMFIIMVPCVREYDKALYITGNDLIAASVLFLCGYDLYCEHSEMCRGYGLSKRSRIISFILISTAFTVISAFVDAVVRISADLILTARMDARYVTLPFLPLVSSLVDRHAKIVPFPVDIIFTFVFFLCAWGTGAFLAALVKRYRKKAAAAAVTMMTVPIIASILTAAGVDLSVIYALPAVVFSSLGLTFLMMLILAGAFLTGAVLVPGYKGERK